MKKATIVLAMLLALLTYLTCAYRNYKWIKAFYSKDGAGYGSAKSLIDILFVLFPFVNLIGWAATIKMNPYTNKKRRFSLK